MILVDTNVFVDIWTDDPLWSEWSSTAVAEAASRTRLAVNPMIYAELCLGFVKESQLAETLRDADVRCLPLPCRRREPSPSTALEEVRAERLYPISSSARTRVFESFRLLTRDAARYRTYFPRVEVIAPNRGSTARGAER